MARSGARRASLSVQAPRTWLGRNASPPARAVEVPLSQLAPVDSGFTLVLPFSIGLLYLLLGGLLYGLKPSRESALAALLCLLAAAFYLTMFDAHTTYWFVRVWLLYPLLGPLSVHLFARFPERRPGVAAAAGPRAAVRDHARRGGLRAARDRRSGEERSRLARVVDPLVVRVHARPRPPRLQHAARLLPGGAQPRQSIFVGLAITCGASVAWQFAARGGTPYLPMTADQAMCPVGALPGAHHLRDPQAQPVRHRRGAARQLDLDPGHRLRARDLLRHRRAGGRPGGALYRPLDLDHDGRHAVAATVQPGAAAGAAPRRSVLVPRSGDPAAAARAPIRAAGRRRISAWPRRRSGRSDCSPAPAAPRCSFVVRGGLGQPPHTEPPASSSRVATARPATRRPRSSSSPAARSSGRSPPIRARRRSRGSARRRTLRRVRAALHPLRRARGSARGQGRAHRRGHAHGPSRRRVRRGALASARDRRAAAGAGPRERGAGGRRGDARATGRARPAGGGDVHEVKNPLGIIKVSAGGLRKRMLAGGDETSAELAACVEDEVDRMDATMRRLLDLARPPAPSLRPCDLAEVIRQTVIRLRPDLAAAGVMVELELSAQPRVSADAEELRRALLQPALERAAGHAHGRHAVGPPAPPPRATGASRSRSKTPATAWTKAPGGSCSAPSSPPATAAPASASPWSSGWSKITGARFDVDSRPGQGSRFVLTLPAS